MSYIDRFFSLENKVALVTGAARGNGKTISEALLCSGATVILVDNNKKELKETIKRFGKQGLDAHEFVGDITKKDTISKLYDYIIKKHKKIDVLVNNAGVSFSHTTIDYPEKFWEQTYRVNLKAPFLISQKFARIIKKQKSGGVIINITSINSELAFPNNPAYQAFKGALKQLTKSLALDFGQYRIRVNSVGPGYIKTEMTKESWKNSKKRQDRANRTILKRWGVPEDLIGVIIFLASDASSYITGQDIYVDGGWLIKGIN
tara:strand:- start:819 stop:1601 length:783 start_codon:yes stop_codon:yes gene_type:complete